MRIILQEDVSNLGVIGDILDVANGYGRNYLIPRGLAVRADERNVRHLEHTRRIIARKQANRLGEAQALADQLNGTSVSIRRTAAEDGEKLFGSVTNRDIAEALVAEGFTIDKRSIVLDEPIKSIGRFQVPVRLHAEISASVQVYVTRE
jgi:large subunit ribosomal protein L9